MLKYGCARSSCIFPSPDDRTAKRVPLFQLHEILSGIHGILVLDEEFRDSAVFLRFDLVERFHHLDQADRVACGDGVPLLHVEIALRIGTAVESAWHLRFHDLVRQGSLLLGSFLSGTSGRAHLHVVLYELSYYGLREPCRSWGVAVDTDRVRGDVYVRPVHGRDLAFCYAPDDPVGNLVRI